MTEIVLESPLVGIPRLGKRELWVDGRSCWLDEVPFVDMLNLRGDASDPTFAKAVQDATGLALPVQANTASVQSATGITGGRQLFWLGPDEWLLKTHDGMGEAVEVALRSALAGKHFAVVQVGSGNTTLTVQGAAAADLINRGCPMDLHPRGFGNGALAQTHIAKANVVLYCLQAGQSYEVTVRRSFADYLYNWLCEAGS
jgi:sarcosine oxidase subunit gamma